jgi:hypothetical protein
MFYTDTFPAKPHLFLNVPLTMRLEPTAPADTRSPAWRYAHAAVSSPNNPASGRNRDNCLPGTPWQTGCRLRHWN